MRSRRPSVRRPPPAIIFAMQLFLQCNYFCNAIIFAMQLFLQCLLSFLCKPLGSWASRETSWGEGRDMRSRRPSVHDLQLFLQCNYFCKDCFASFVNL